MSEDKKRTYVFMVEITKKTDTKPESLDGIKKDLLALGVIDGNMRANLIKIEGVLFFSGQDTNVNIPVKILSGEIKKGEKIVLERLNFSLEDVVGKKP